MTIEKIYPLSFPNFDKVLLLDAYKVRQAKIYYIREKIGKDARMKSISTAEQRGVDLFAVAKGNLPEVIVDQLPDPQNEEDITEEVIAEEAIIEETVTEEAVTENNTTEEVAVEDAVVEETTAEAVTEDVEAVAEEVVAEDATTEESPEKTA